ncbi:MAG: Lsr2 family protein [Aeromicrobium sp.]
MAKKTIEIITSDLSGEELDRGEGRTILFSVGDSAYSIDLTDDEAKEFHDTLAKYTSVAARRSGRSAAPARKTTGSSGSGRTSEELAHIRAWANSNGHAVSERGRIKAEIIEAFDKAND